MLATFALLLAPATIPADGWISFDQTAISSSRMGCKLGAEVSLGDHDKGWSVYGDKDSQHERFTVYVELVDGKPNTVHAFSPDCVVTDADRAVKIDLSAAEAVTAIDEWLAMPAPREASSRMIAIVAHLEDDLADAVLERVAEDVSRKDESNEALFWLASLRGDSGRQIVGEHLEARWPLEHRKHALVSLGLSKHPQAVETVREVARTAEEPELRASGVTALALAEAPGTLADLHSILLSDTSDAVREHAIFWIAQNRHSDAAGILADVARDPRYGKHRKTALFWLAQMRSSESAAVFDDLFGDVL